MKKISTLALFLLMGTMGVLAQTNNTCRFVDKDGKEVPNDTKLTITEAEDDGWGEPMLPSGLYVRNTASEEVSLRIHCQLETLDNGSFQICFPTNCIAKTSVETFTTPSGPMSAEEIKDLQTEWLPIAYGKCTAVYQIEMMKLVSLIPPQYESLGMGPKVTVEYIYADPTGIDATLSRETSELSVYYNLNGTRLDAPQRGLNIVRMKNGQTIKQVKR